MRTIPQVTKYLLIINIVMFLLTELLSPMGINLTNLLGLHFFEASDFHVYQFITYMFMHGGWMHIIMNMFMLWMFGMVIENVWGPKKFLFYYIICGLGAGLCQEIVQFFEIWQMFTPVPGSIGEAFTAMQAHANELNMFATVGASGAIYAILLAFGMLFPDERMFIIPIPIPIKAKWIVIGSVALELFYALGQPGDGVAHVAHLGGMLFGFLLIKYWQKHPYSGTGDFGMGKGAQFFDRMKNSWDRHTSHTASGGTKFHYRPNTDTRRESDWDYNARKKAEQDEIDRILDKIRHSGYDSLSNDEKRKLFEQSKK